MNTNLNSSRRFASTLLIALALAGGASAQTASPADLAQRAEAARTKGDYEALAADYDKQAAAARAIAAQHRKMAKDSQAMVASGRGGASMPAHCNAIAGKNEGLDKDYDAMAAGYRQLAAKAQP